MFNWSNEAAETSAIFPSRRWNCFSTYLIISNKLSWVIWTPLTKTCWAGLIKNGVFTITVKYIFGWNIIELPGIVNYKKNLTVKNAKSNIMLNVREPYNADRRKGKMKQVIDILTSLHKPSRLALKQLSISSNSISPFCISTFAFEGLISKQYTKRYLWAKNFNSVRYVIRKWLHCVKFCSLGIADITSMLLHDSV